MAVINKPSQPLIPPTDVEEVEEIATNAAEAAIAADDTHAPLVDDKVPAAHLPSYVDDVLNFDSVEAFPEEGEEGKIYVANDTNLTYRWSGAAYIQVGGASLAAGDGIEIENDIVSVDLPYIEEHIDHVTSEEFITELDKKANKGYVLELTKLQPDEKNPSILVGDLTDEQIEQLRVNYPNVSVSLRGKTFIDTIIDAYEDLREIVWGLTLLDEKGISSISVDANLVRKYVEVTHIQKLDVLLVEFGDGDVFTPIQCNQFRSATDIIFKFNYGGEILGINDIYTLTSRSDSEITARHDLDNGFKTLNVDLETGEWTIETQYSDVVIDLPYEGDISKEDLDKITNNIDSVILRQRYMAEDANICYFHSVRYTGRALLARGVNEFGYEALLRINLNDGSYTIEPIELNPEVGDEIQSWIDAAVAPKANIADTYTKAQVDTALAPKANSADVELALKEKQDVISDLDTIRSGAAAGVSAKEVSDELTDNGASPVYYIHNPYFSHLTDDDKNVLKSVYNAFANEKLPKLYCASPIVNHSPAAVSECILNYYDHRLDILIPYAGRSAGNDGRETFNGQIRYYGLSVSNDQVYEGTTIIPIHPYKDHKHSWEQWDDTPTANSTKVITSGSVYDALAPKANSADVQTALSEKQDTLVSGTNIKTINGQSILGSGDLEIALSQSAQTEVQSMIDAAIGNVLTEEF